MVLRRLLFFLLLAVAALGLIGLLEPVLAAGGWTPAKALIFLCFIGVAPWLGVCVGNAALGFAVLLAARWPARAVLPVRGGFDLTPITAQSALAVTIRNERIETVLAPLGRLLEGLQSAGVAERFTAWVLSDTSDPDLAAAEQVALAAFPHPVRYRRRSGNVGFKAGNVMDFLDHHAEGLDFAIMLDADSEMSAAAVLRLVRIMQAAPRMGIVQHLTVGRPAAAAFPRLFQFGMRAGMRVWATGQAVWQGDEGPYWGHNAVLRIAPFRQHCRLERLRDGSEILSHDQMEAARLRAAGWGVCVWAKEAGSLEANPPALPEFLERDTRWLAGNLQYRHLLGLAGLRPMGRWQLVQAILLFAGAPLYVAMLALAAGVAAIGGWAAAEPRQVAAFSLAWLGAIYSPKLLGYAEVLLSRRRRARYGGGLRFAAGATAEFVFSLLLDAPAQVHKTLAMLGLALGLRPGWLAQNRAARPVGWAEAARMFWPHTLFGVVVFAGFLWASPFAALWATPFAGGLPVAIPFAVLSADPRLSAWLRAHRIAAVPEEIPGALPLDPAGGAAPGTPAKGREAL